jgi:hypothetical protein
MPYVLFFFADTYMISVVTCQYSNNFTSGDERSSQSAISIEMNELYGCYSPNKCQLNKRLQKNASR